MSDPFQTPAGNNNNNKKLPFEDEKHDQKEDDDDEYNDVFRGFDSTELGPSLGATLVMSHHNPTTTTSTTHAQRLGVTTSTTTGKTSTAAGSMPLDSETPPCPPGMYFEPHHTLPLNSGCTPQHALQSVMTVLTTLSVDFSTLELHAFRLYCFHYSVAQEIPFVVSLFSTESNELVLEFQRRSGSVSSFCELYSSIASRLAELNVVPTNCVPPARKFRPPQLSISTAAPSAEETTFMREAVTALFAMIRSEYLDVRVEGLNSVAQLSTDESKRPTIAELGKADLLQCLSHSNSDVHRAALTIIANLCETVKEVAAWAMLDGVYLLTHGKSLSPQIIREATRLLRNFASHVRPRNSTDRPLVSTLKRLALSKDERTKDYANGGLSFCTLD